MDEHLKMTIDLSRASFDSGEFPAGAVLVTKSGNIYKSDPSIVHNHAEMTVIDKAFAAKDAPLDGAVLYASMEPCLMCVAKMFWSGIEKCYYIIPKTAVKAEYAYEDNGDIDTHIRGFFKHLSLQQIGKNFYIAMEIYNDWVKKVERK